MTLRIDDDTIKARARLIPEKRFPHRLPRCLLWMLPCGRGLVMMPEQITTETNGA